MTHKVSIIWNSETSALSQEIFIVDKVIDTYEPVHSQLVGFYPNIFYPTFKQTDKYDELYFFVKNQDKIWVEFR